MYKWYRWSDSNRHGFPSHFECDVSAISPHRHMAEYVGFEPTVAYTTPPFQDGAFDHSANIPTYIYNTKSNVKMQIKSV